jgi:hypothetical protein
VVKSSRGVALNTHIHLEWVELYLYFVAMP